MTVYETDVPGVGKKYEVDTADGTRLVILLHHDGRREIYLRPDDDADSERLFSLTGKQARQVGSILEGAYFQPVELEDVTVPLGDAIIEWVDVPADSDVVGKTLQSLGLRNRTGVSIIAIQRGKETVPNPGPEETIRSDDILVTIGTREEQASLAGLVAADQPMEPDDNTGY
ncbi:MULTISPECIES: cation:proton antiporter regulatory subunit [unclassified Haladaptatus]|uniref:cation:proton antiporter regulatory subunit n=1 Tax=unclassified Haladaptatus TaxID=2622732 RepID=UPI00209BEFAA|nr:MULTISPECIES: cation:proton antiporter regulatory subunit [unclassified Haladaptatus]MCO8243285.1 cation:proton antiporter regulatory subunit [Haladaptatus sp. AB643]MCO8252996.1 cation:proton antiporter regulatory subunit [Haladaptatus sp. AB618]